ncbi:MAG: hypothetical protein AB7F19_05785 [Candidatus Babeliales bacterium]
MKYSSNTLLVLTWISFLFLASFLNNAMDQVDTSILMIQEKPIADRKAPQTPSTLESQIISLDRQIEIFLTSGNHDLETLNSAKSLCAQRNLLMQQYGKSKQKTLDGLHAALKQTTKKILALEKAIPTMRTIALTDAKKAAQLAEIIQDREQALTEHKDEQTAIEHQINLLTTLNNCPEANNTSADQTVIDEREVF